MMVIQATSSAAAPRRAAAPSQPTEEPKESFSWGKALALPAYVYGPLSGGLSLATGYAQAFPAGGFTLNPGQGIHLNPEWTRNFAEGTVLRTAQPIVAGMTALLLGVRGAMELKEGKTVAGALDLGAAVASAASILSPTYGGLATIGLIAARGVVDLH
jgi:hypothetical protein